MAMVEQPEEPVLDMNDNSNPTQDSNVPVDSSLTQRNDETPNNQPEELETKKSSPSESSTSTSTSSSKCDSENSSTTSSRPSSRESEKISNPSTAGPLPQHQYDKEQLMKLAKLPEAKKWPSFLDSAFSNASGIWDPEKWFKSKRRSESPLVDDLRIKRERPAEFERDPGSTFKRRTPDPKERIKEERDDIVLSPQRRSFGTGCHVSAQTTTFSNRRPGSPDSIREPESIHRDSRRIGSGRILNRDRDRDWEKEHTRDYGYGNRNRDNRDRFDRDDREKDTGRYVNRYRSNDRRISRGRDDRIEEEEEPEWFSGGPTSQHETIELVGFDENSSDDRKVMGRGRRGKENNRRQPQLLAQLPLSDRRINEQPLDSNAKNSMNNNSSSSGQVASSKLDNEKPEPKASKSFRSSTPPNEHAQGNASTSHSVTNTTNTATNNSNSAKKKDFDLNDIFKMDFIPELLQNGTQPEVPETNLGGSRFSQWFNRDSPVHDFLVEEESRRSSIQDEIMAQVLGIGGSSMSLTPPSSQQSSNYFIPINPQVSQAHMYSEGPHHRKPGGGNEKNILEILQNANINVGPLLNNENSHSASLKKQALSGKVKSVVELEADLKQLVLGNKRSVDGDKSAFNKLLNHLADSHGVSSTGPSMSMGPLDKSKALQEEDLIHNLYMGPSMLAPPNHPSAASHHHHPHLHHPHHPPPSHPMGPPDLRISPTPSLTNSLGGGAASLMDFLKDTEKPAMPPMDRMSVSKESLQDQTSVADLLRTWSEHNNSNQNSNTNADMLSQLMSQSHPPPPLLQHPINQQPNMYQAAAEKMNPVFHNKTKPNNSLEILAQQQPRQKFMASLVPASFGHLLPPSPTPSDLTCQTLGIPLPMGPHLSPRQSPLSHDIAAGVHNQGRIPSPLVFGQQPPILSHAPAPIHPSQVGMGQPNTLQVQNPAAPRVPSPQELAAHTQTILQNALIKRKLEEQKENFRKRQQEAQRSRSPNVTVASSSSSTTITNNNITKPPSTVTTSSASPSKQTFTPAMVAFTPTSVMRKMHSEKLDKEGRGLSPSNNLMSPEHKLHEDSSHYNGNNKPLINHGHMNNIPPHAQQMQTEHVTQRAITNNNSGMGVPQNAPRALHGQGMYNPQQQQQVQQQQVQQQQVQQRSLQQALAGGQGRPIVKGGSMQGGPEIGRDGGGWTAMPPKINMAHNKPFMVPNQSNIMRTEIDPMARLVEQQRLLSQQQVLGNQRQLNASPMAPLNQTGYPMGPRGPNVLPPHHQNILRPNMNNVNNVNIPLLRSMVQAQANFGHPNIRAPNNQMNQISQLNQLAALQQQQQAQQQQQQQVAAAQQQAQQQAQAQAQHQQQVAQQQRKALESRPALRNLHPLAIQQLLLNVQSQAAASAIMPLNNNMGMTGRNDMNFGNNPGLKPQQLMPPGQGQGNRHSPVNLARWFGNDVLKQKMPDMPPVPMQNALSVEEVERQQQHTAIVHN